METITHPVDYIISPKTTIIIPGLGFVKSASSQERGDLVVKFNIVFPERIEEAKKIRISEILGN